MLTKSLDSLDLNTAKTQQKQIQGGTMLDGKQTVGFAFAHYTLLSCRNNKWPRWEHVHCLYFLFCFQFSVYMCGIDKIRALPLNNFLNLF